MLLLLYAMAGGAIGTGARYLAGRYALAAFGPGFPYGTLAVNLVGGLLMGALAGTLVRLGQGGETARVVLGVGVLGGFTTFSAFSLDLALMIQRGDVGVALGYALLSVAGALAALFAGLALARVAA